ncbi:hypothetical protein DGo_CA0945 [Deinococcus gobiensis I-0]|uniref:Uncharacterized protein n=1 Tax=Deinococcus gobiensis (strain DSM 21396 / JCM 16679 / CGMCC 1.7299 / I-0) TaxID=745776 RepID=H8GYU5_DEIGI|nr:hypothetical protein DGo_CA0945 [Deinococcus gobiensis I-0]
MAAWGRRQGCAVPPQFRRWFPQTTGPLFLLGSPLPFAARHPPDSHRLGLAPGYVRRYSCGS